MPQGTPCPTCGTFNTPETQRCACGQWNPDWNPNLWRPPAGMSWFLVLVVAVSILSILSFAKQVFFSTE
jgi:hypothetical protein